MPRDFWAEEPAWRRLLAHLGHGQRRVLDRLGIDVRHLEMPSPPETALGRGLVQNFWGERYIYRETPWGRCAKTSREPLAGRRASPTWKPSPGRRLTTSITRRFRNSAAATSLMHCSTDSPMSGKGPAWCGAGRGCSSTWPSGPSGSISSPLSSPISTGRTTHAAEATAGRIDLYLLVSDLGSQTGPLISLNMFRQFVAPYLKQMIDCIHGLGGRVLYHTCGTIRAFIPDLVALGVDVLDPIQPTGPEMSPERLKADFGSRIAFHGGIDMQNILPHGTPSEVRAEAQRYCEVLGRGGGYILGPAHLFQPDVPPENILAMYEGGW